MQESNSEAADFSNPRKNQESNEENAAEGKSGVGNGNRTRNRRSHSPVLCQLSYSHRRIDYTNLRFAHVRTPRSTSARRSQFRVRPTLCITSNFNVTDDLDFAK